MSASISIRKAVKPHIYGHGVTQDEAIDILQNPAEDLVGQEGSRVATGQTEGGRYLRVVYVPEPGGSFVITANELTGKPLMHIDDAVVGKEKDET